MDKNVLTPEQGGKYQIKLTDLGRREGARITDGLAEVKNFIKDINTYTVLVDDTFIQALPQRWLRYSYKGKINLNREVLNES